MSSEAWPVGCRLLNDRYMWLRCQHFFTGLPNEGKKLYQWFRMEAAAGGKKHFNCVKNIWMSQLCAYYHEAGVNQTSILLRMSSGQKSLKEAKDNTIHKTWIKIKGALFCGHFYGKYHPNLTLFPWDGCQNSTPLKI